MDESFDGLDWIIGQVIKEEKNLGGTGRNWEELGGTGRNSEELGGTRRNWE